MTHSPRRAAARDATERLVALGIDRHGPRRHRAGIDPTEAELQATVTEAATAGGWRWWHARDSRRQAVTDWPDVALAHPAGALILAELKRADGLATPGQAAALEVLVAGPALVVLWRPDDLGRALELLAHPLELAARQAPRRGLEDCERPLSFWEGVDGGGNSRYHEAMPRDIDTARQAEADRIVDLAHEHDARHGLTIVATCPGCGSTVVDYPGAPADLCPCPPADGIDAGPESPF